MLQEDKQKISPAFKTEGMKNTQKASKGMGTIGENGKGGWFV